MILLDWNTVAESVGGFGLPLRFEAAEKTELYTTDIVDEDERLFAFPSPLANSGLNLLNLRRLVGVDPAHQPAFFDHPWYLEEPFAGMDCPPGWHILRMEPNPGSIEQPFNYCSSLERAGWTLPTAMEVVLMLFLHYLRTGEQLLLKKHTWCRDEASLGRRVTVGAFGRNGVFISSHPPGFASRGLGICGKLMLPPSGGVSR